MSYDDDSREIADRINEEIEQVISEYWPGWITGVQKGQRVALVTPRVKEKGKKPTSSFVVQLEKDRGKWFRFSQDVGGYGMQLVAYGLLTRLATSKEDWREVFSEARRILGIEQSPRQELTPEQRVEREARRQQDELDRQARNAAAEAKEAERREERTQTASEVWKGTTPLSGTLGDVYLQSRGLPPVEEWPWSPDHVLRFHPSLPYELDRKAGSFPAIIGRVQSMEGGGAAVWRIYLSKDGKDKAPVDVAKVGLGPAGGGAVRLGGEGESIGVGEGIETCLSAWLLNGCRKPVWACLSTSGMVGFEIPAFVKRLEIFPDGDKAKIQSRPGGSFTITDRPGMAAARGLEAEAVPILGRENVSIAQEPSPGRDFNDIYNDMRKKGLI